VCVCASYTSVIRSVHPSVRIDVAAFSFLVFFCFVIFSRLVRLRLPPPPRRCLVDGDKKINTYKFYATAARGNYIGRARSLRNAAAESVGDLTARFITAQ